MQDNYKKEYDNIKESFFSAVERDDAHGVCAIVGTYPEAVTWKNAAAENKTALHIAIEKEHTKAAFFLLQHGADVNAVSDRGSTPLMYAAWADNAAIARILLENGADINARNTDGVTALMPAAYNGHRNMVQLLIVHGADIDLEDTQGLTAESFAQEKGHDEIVEIIQKWVAQPAKPAPTPEPANDPKPAVKIPDSPDIDSLVNRLKKAKLIK